MLHTIFFDLDNTLYPRTSGIWEAIGARISLFMTDVLEIPEDEVLPMRMRFREQFGTTLAGLQSRYVVDEATYLDYVHDVDLHAMLHDDGRLHALIQTISQRKIIFTNADIKHANRVLDIFGIRDAFDLVIDVLAMNPWVKPQPEAYHQALEMAGLKSASGCVFIDDMVENVAQGIEEGFECILVAASTPGFLCIPNIFHLPQVLADLGAR